MACAAPPQAATPDLAAEEQAIRAHDATWLGAVKARDAAAEVAVLADDALVFREHVNPMCPAEYQAFETKYLTDNPERVDGWTTPAIHVANSGDMAVQIGTYALTGLGPRGDVSENGNFLTYWKKVNGEWKVGADMSVDAIPEMPASKSKM